MAESLTKSGIFGSWDDGSSVIMCPSYLPNGDADSTTCETQ
jgi:hypothetical protein